MKKNFSCKKASWFCVIYFNAGKRQRCESRGKGMFWGTEVSCLWYSNQKRYEKKGKLDQAFTNNASILSRDVIGLSAQVLYDGWSGALTIYISHNCRLELNFVNLPYKTDLKFILSSAVYWLIEKPRDKLGWLQRNMFICTLFNDAALNEDFRALNALVLNTKGCGMKESWPK